MTKRGSGNDRQGQRCYSCHQICLHGYSRLHKCTIKVPLELTHFCKSFFQKIYSLKYDFARLYCSFRVMPLNIKIYQVVFLLTWLPVASWNHFSYMLRIYYPLSQSIFQVNFQISRNLDREWNKSFVAGPFHNV